jgi:hypothetical protein
MNNPPAFPDWAKDGMTQEKSYSALVFPEVNGIIQTQFSQAELGPVWDEINKIQNNFEVAEPHNAKLVGHVKKEYVLTDCRSYLESLLLPFVDQHAEHFEHLNSLNILTKPLPYFLANAWVNFQEKHEFNPIHHHTGVMSFVLWMKVPFNIEDEFAVFPNVASQRTACFEFIYVNHMGKVASKIFAIDKTCEGCMFLFPANLNHCVNPFYTSDDYRISVSGNFVFQVP